jgi:DNA-binding GntR family transcriptional regulator
MNQLPIAEDGQEADDLLHTRQELVADHVRQAIMIGQVHPGDRLIEQSLAAELHMSRGPVRDALRQLEQEGLVQIYRNRGAVVSTLGLREAYEFYLVRGHLEGLAIRLARDYMQPDDIDHLQQIVDQMAALHGSHEDWLTATSLDLAFHTSIVACSRNQSLIHTYTSMNVKMNALFMTVKQYMPLRLSLMPARHQKLIDVFRAGDWWRAEPVVTDHWHETAAQFKLLLEADQKGSRNE